MNPSHSQDTIQQKEAHFINDKREVSAFKSISFSGFKKSEVKQALLEALHKGKIEQACYWSGELICAGQFMDLWELLLFYLGKHIHLGNPKLAIYLLKRFHIFRNIVIQGSYFQELDLRNQQTVRNLFGEIVCIFALSPKKPSLELTKMKQNEEFDITLMQERLMAPTSDYANNILHKEDPKELLLAINEFSYHLSKTNHVPNLAYACYWAEWIMSFEQICKKRKQPCVGKTRETVPVEFQYQKEIIWIVWDALFFHALEDSFVIQILQSILELYCIKFTPASVKKRKHLLYFAISILTEPFIREVPLIANKTIIEHSLMQLNTIYKQIKKNEMTPLTDYLFDGIDCQDKLEKTRNQIERMNQISYRLVENQAIR